MNLSSNLLAEAHQPRVDVVVIGGGPAGSATGLMLAKAGFTVTIIEGGDDRGWKVGEGLPPVSRPILQHLGVWERFVADCHLPSYGNCSSWGSWDLIDQNFIFNPYGHGWHLDRRRFDNMLARAAIEAGTTRLASTKVEACHRAVQGGWKLELLSAENARSSLTTDFVVDATGRSSWFARQQGARRISYDSLVGLVALLNSPKDIPDSDSFTLIEAVEEGWWYSALLPDGKLVVAFLSDGDLGSTKGARTIEGWWTLMKRTEYLRTRVESHNYYVEIGPRIMSASTSQLTQIAAESWLAVGDAAAAYDPLSSQGIKTALEMAVEGAKAILQRESRSVSKYVQAINHTFAEYLANRRLYYARERRWPDSPFWKRRWALPLDAAAAREASSSSLA